MKMKIKSTTTLLLFSAVLITTPSMGDEKLKILKEIPQIKYLNYAQNIFRKKLQKKCGYTAAYWAEQHTQKGWRDIVKTKEDFKREFKEDCPKGYPILKDKWIEPLNSFAIEYARNSGKRPKC